MGWMIEYVALRFPNGLLKVAKKPARHHNLIHENWDLHQKLGIPEEGFYDEMYGFLTRQEAAKLALQTQQIKELSRPDTGELFSEDLW